MVAITASDARREFFQLARECAVTSEPVHIKTKTGDVVLINSRSWAAMKELLEIAELTDLRSTLLQGVAIPVNQCKELKNKIQDGMGVDCEILLTPGAEHDMKIHSGESEQKRIEKAFREMKHGMPDPELLPCPLLDGVLTMKRVGARKFIFFQHIRNSKTIKVVRIVM